MTTFNLNQAIATARQASPSQASGIAANRAPSFMASPLSVQRKAGLMDWLFGTSPSQATLPKRTDPPTDPRNQPDLEIKPPTQSNFWVESLFNALTEATTLFAKRHVELVHQEDPSTVYKVREVKIECKDAPAQFLRDLASLPAEVRNRVVKSRMHKAPGAEYLDLQDFFGSTIAADITLVEGQVVQTLVSYSGSRFVLKFAFEGEYVSRPAGASAPAAPTAALPATQATAQQTEPAPTAATPAGQATLQPTLQPTTLPIDPQPSRHNPHTAPYIVPTDLSGPVQGTALRIHQPVSPRPSGDTTPVRAASESGHKPLAMLRLRSQDEEVTLPLQADNFPYTLGRHDSFKGYSLQGRKDSQATRVLHEREPAQLISFVSRGHVVLDSFDASTGQFRVITSKGKNGSFFKAAAIAERTLLPMAAMAQGDWVKLGGTSGDGILELRIEAV